MSLRIQVLNKSLVTRKRRRNVACLFSYQSLAKRQHWFKTYDQLNSIPEKAASCRIAKRHALQLQCSITLRLALQTELDNKTRRFYVFTLNAKTSSHLPNSVINQMVLDKYCCAQTSSGHFTARQSNRCIQRPHCVCS